MLPVWALWTIFAALMQAVRTAGQKRLNEQSSIAIATAARALFGLPFALAYTAYTVPNFWNYLNPVNFNIRFTIAILACALFQLIATAWLIKLFSLRNFAIGSIYSKAEILLTALIGTLFFDELLSLTGWGAILLATLGLGVLTYAKNPALRFKGMLAEPSAQYGLLSSLAFALTSLFARDASLTLDALPKSQAAAIVLLLVLFIQALSCLIWIYLPGAGPKKPLVFMFSRLRLCLFIGITSAAGSIGWFTAMALINASYVKVLGQIELLIIYLISIFIFRDRLSKLEWLGTFILAFSLLGLIWV